MTENLNWWRGAVIYQVYPRSLHDSNNDGIGDLKGIINKLDYIASLGVDAIWISPCFKSPMKDFGYDISDYRDIDPIFGDLTDFDELIEKAHSLDIKVMIDQVLSHTSDQHDWFTESRQDKTNQKADWYVWADPNPDGTPPNNWQAIFGGPAWQWDSRRCQYYLHNFLASQPDLNFHNSDVQKAVLDNVEFWLKRGVDGLRLDAITFCFHDQELRDNPAKPEELRAGRGFSEDNPYAYQYHYFNNERPENIGFIEQIRALLDRYPGTVSLGEISSEDSLKTMAEYSKGDNRLHMTYSFELLTDDYSTDYVKNTVSTLESALTDGWPCWAVGNHDVARVVTRWGENTQNPDFPKMVTAMLGSLRGSLCVYQGEELGLTEALVPYDKLQDPYGIEFWPTFKGRDGCRTPIPWDDQAKNAGFSDGTPWLPVDEAHVTKSVNLQEKDENSVLNAYRAFMKWRKQQPALINGSLEFLDLDPNCLVIKRVDPASGQNILAAFNFTDKVLNIQSDALKDLTQIKLNSHNNAKIEQGELTIPAFGVFFSTFQ
ncbi:alpha-amylase family glycosyl hydrolase [Catenovulum sp. 2E275]|uniref:alpha-amylase family glycosyl hydrolase n=1 Tax=Catenovulum sp. 2E275 TaxID=2980497 RepID=UPI0021CE419A|nr:alpha-amylase family glycosyl hydrolase [Catenovulum sp. 2E275]MCU4676980.1 alpha-amylase family glycosyl hydrolase [Catenovulum sp. 2E275]